ncbi:MAG: hypothetical protein IKP00_06725 [Victivallales bacterium]|nr:hypothetical protein [Victivallales bacterium]
MKLRFFMMCLGLSCACLHSAEDANWEAMKRAARERPREVIYNTDGCDALYYPNDLAVTPENFKSRRLVFTEGTEVASLLYCPVTSGFCHVTLPTQIGDQLLRTMDVERPSHNCTSELFALGTDPLKLAVEYSRAHNLEAFASFRMNDTHDAAQREEKPYPLFPPFKKEHPEVLFGSEKQRPSYCNWTAVDYAQPIVRQRILGLIEETCQRYELDGVECDFMRHAQLFKSVGLGGTASAEELALLTEMMTKLRAITEAEGYKRKRPILIAVRVPDSVEYCRAIGIDLETWLQKGLVDLLITTSYFQLNHWNYSAALAHKYGVKFYASLDESRIREYLPAYGNRNSQACYAARALAARRAGADGIYLFNCERSRLTACGIGSIEALAFKNKVYYATVRGSGGYRPGGYLRNGESYRNMTSIEPKEPAALEANGKLDFDIEIGDDLSDKEIAARCLEVTAQMRTNQPQLDFILTVNGKAYHADRTADDDILEFELDKTSLQPGMNHFQIANSSADLQKEVQMRTVLKGDQVMVYGKNQGRWRRFAIFNGQQESIEENAYCLEDISNEIGGALYHPLFPVKGTATRARFSMKVKKTEEPDAVVARIADGQFVEVIQFQPKSISLKYAGQSVPFVTDDAFHTYNVVVDKGKLTLEADGRTLLTAELPARATDSQYALENVAPGIGIPNLHTAGLVIGSLAGKGMGSALWKDVQLDDSGVSISDFAVKISYMNAAAAQLIKLKDEPIHSSGMVQVRDGACNASDGVVGTYLPEGCRVSEDGGSLVLEHDLRNKTQHFNMLSALKSAVEHRFVAAEWKVQALRDGENVEPCFQIVMAPARPDGKGVWEFSVRSSTKAISTLMGVLPVKRFDPKAVNHFKLLIDTQSGEAVLWCNGQLAISGTIKAGAEREKPFLLVGDASGNIAGQARLFFLNIGYVGE